jgi:hypothetical protein
MARNLSGVLLAAAVTLASGCQALPTSGGDSAAAVSISSGNSLPPDGSWVRYVVSHESTSHPYRGRKAKSDANVETEKIKSWSEKITLSFVGRTVENGVPCRWVEIRTEKPDQQADKPCAYKVLLKEEGLLSDKHPLAEKNVLRVWQQTSDGTVSRRDDSLGYSDLFSWTPGAVRQMKPTGETREIDFASSHLSSATAYSGKTTTNAYVALGVSRRGVPDRTHVGARTESIIAAHRYVDQPAGRVAIDASMITARRRCVNVPGPFGGSPEVCTVAHQAARCYCASYCIRHDRKNELSRR